MASAPSMLRLAGSRLADQFAAVRHRVYPEKEMGRRLGGRLGPSQGLVGPASSRPLPGNDGRMTATTLMCQPWLGSDKAGLPPTPATGTRTFGCMQEHSRDIEHPPMPELLPPDGTASAAPPAQLVNRMTRDGQEKADERDALRRVYWDMLWFW